MFFFRLIPIPQPQAFYHALISGLGISPLPRLLLFSPSLINHEEKADTLTFQSASAFLTFTITF
ncbi:MAG TPA: hypothetical protein DCZ40_02030 [Lachnospiraceae bacterium]|nr:hypothetical protein [Lachnospiraceae bacterium]